MNKSIKVLFFGDVVGTPGCRAIFMLLKNLIKEYGATFTIVNGENAADGFGLTPSIADQFFSYGVDVITSGNHIWQKDEILPYLEKNNTVLRPCNYPVNVPGKGSCVHEKHGVRLGVINAIGRQNLVMVDCPLAVTAKTVNEIKNKADIIFVDFHAEVTEEKEALACHLDGKVGAVVGTHTHIQTADERILENGTAYITDVGMTGPINSVIGGNPSGSIHRVTTQMPHKISVADGDVAISGVCVEFDRTTGKAIKIERIRKELKAHE